MNRSKIIIVKRVLFTILSAFCVCFIFTRSIMPAGKSSQESGRILMLLNSITEFFGMGSIFTQFIVRKCAHFVEFGVLSACLFGMYRTYMKGLIKVSVFTSLSYLLVAIIDEFIQLFSFGRACRFADVLVDCSGGTATLIFLLFICVLINRKLKSQEDVRNNYE